MSVVFYCKLISYILIFLLHYKIEKKMALPNITKTRKFFAKIVTFWIPIKKYRKVLRGILLMGIGNYVRVIKKEKTRKFPHELSVVTILKDEGEYLKEWLDFHILVGVEKFYVYDNGSTDNSKEVLEPYIQRGIVEYIYFPVYRMQNSAYIDAINRFSEESKWMAIIDLDEFVVPVQNKTITEFLYTLPRNFGALVMTWVMYGSSGHVKKPEGLVIENFKHRANRSRPAGCKSIINPRLIVRQYNPHINDFAGFIIDENAKKLGFIDQTNNPPSYEKIRCNHYFTKSYDEYKIRCEKGSVGGNKERKKWSQEKFEKYDTNDVYDDIMDKYIPLLKKM